MTKSTRVFRNKAIDVQADYWENWWNYFNIDIYWSRRKYADHAGFHLILEVVGYMFAFTLYDTRHAPEREADNE